MKIGIVTQPLLNNYGGILQNFALHQELKSLGHSPITLDFLSGYSGLSGFYWVARRFINYLLGRISKFNEIFDIYAPKRQNREIDDFIKKHINCTSTFWNGYSPSLIDKYKLDAIIVGSDQVWRPMYNQKLTSMFLDFASKHQIRKIAYAASFGTSEYEFSKKISSEIAPLIKQFDAISVRENSGIELVNMLGASAVNVLDPTLLLGREGFEMLLSHKDKQNNLGIYILDGLGCPEDDSIINQIKIKADCSSVSRFTAGEKGMGPIEWLESIWSSKFFITDSFHGTVFCLLFHIPFITVININRGADRFLSLLKPFGLEYRLVSSIDNYSDCIGIQINWEKVDNTLKGYRVMSRNFLATALKNIK